MDCSQHRGAFPHDRPHAEGPPVYSVCLVQSNAVGISSISSAVSATELKLSALWRCLQQLLSQNVFLHSWPARIATSACPISPKLQPNMLCRTMQVLCISPSKGVPDQEHGEIEYIISHTEC